MAMTAFLSNEAASQPPSYSESDLISVINEIEGVISRYEQRIYEDKLPSTEAVLGASKALSEIYDRLIMQRADLYRQTVLPRETGEEFTEIGTTVNGQEEQISREITITPPASGMVATDLRIDWRKTSGEDRRIRPTSAVKSDGTALFKMTLIEPDAIEKNPRVFFKGSAVFRFTDAAARESAKLDVEDLRQRAEHRVGDVASRLRAKESLRLEREALAEAKRTEELKNERAGRAEVLRQNQERVRENWRQLFNTVVAIICAIFGGAGLSIIYMLRKSRRTPNGRKAGPPPVAAG